MHYRRLNNYLLLFPRGSLIHPKTLFQRIKASLWVVLYIRVRFGALLKRVPYYIGDLETDPS